MRLTERQALADEVIRQVGCQQGRVLGGGPAGGLVDGGMLEHRRAEPHRGPHRVHAVEEPLFILLQIAIVSQRQTLEQREQRHQVPNDAPGLCRAPIRPRRDSAFAA